MCSSSDKSDYRNSVFRVSPREGHLAEYLSLCRLSAGLRSRARRRREASHTALRHSNEFKTPQFSHIFSMWLMWLKILQGFDTNNLQHPQVPKNDFSPQVLSAETPPWQRWHQTGSRQSPHTLWLFSIAMV